MTILTPTQILRLNVLGGGFPDDVLLGNLLNELLENTLFKDAFGRGRVASPTTLFDSKQDFSSQALQFSESLVGGGGILYEQAFARSRLSTAGGAADRAIRQTKRYLPYQTGKSQSVSLGVAPNGGDSVKIVLRSATSGSPVDTVVEQASWNKDTLDGSGTSSPGSAAAANNPSGLSLDLTKTQLMILDFSGAGVGTVQVGFVLGGSVVYVHEFNESNLGAVAYMQTPNLPVRWELENVSGAAQKKFGYFDANNGIFCRVDSSALTETLDALGCSVISDGGVQGFGNQRTASRAGTAAAVTNTPEPVISLRLKAASPRVSVLPTLLSLLSDTPGSIFYQIVLNPTFTGGAGFSWVSVANSAVEYDVTHDGAYDGNGTVLSEGYFSDETEETLFDKASESLASALALASDVAGTPEILSVICRNASGTNAENIFAALSWVEEF